MIYVGSRRLALGLRQSDFPPRSHYFDAIPADRVVVTEVEL